MVRLSVLVRMSALCVQVAVPSAEWCRSPSKASPVLSGHHIPPSLQPSGGAIQVGQPGEAGTPMLEAAVVLVLISQAGQDRAQCPCHGPISLVVIDESCVVRWHAEVTVCSLQAL